MNTFRIVLVLTLILSALAITATAHADPHLPSFCQMPDGTLVSGHCNDAQNAAGGHDVHLPAVPTTETPSSGTPPPPPASSTPGTGDPPPPPSSGSNTTPVYSGVDCHIKHAATPAQICSIENGLQYWYIGADGSAQPGPFLPDSPKIEIYNGVNPLTGKSVTIDYVTEGDKTLLRVSTYYPDNEYDTDKPYVFTLDPGYEVNHIQW